MTVSNAEQDRRKELADRTREQVRASVLRVLVDSGRQAIHRPIFRDQTDSPVMRDASPADGLVIARAIELQARRQVTGYIRDAREAGMSWHKIGELLNLKHEAKANAMPVAAMAWEIAIGPIRRGGWTDYRSFHWRCGACGHLINDEGPVACPESGRGGHAESCRRLADEVRDYNREDSQ